MNVLHFLYPSRIILYIYKTCKLSCFSHVQLLATLWTVAHQSPLHMGFSRQGYWSGLPCHPPRGLPDPRIEPMSLTSPALTGGFFTTGSPRLVCMHTDTHTHTHTHILPHFQMYMQSSFHTYSLLHKWYQMVHTVYKNTTVLFPQHNNFWHLVTWVTKVELFIQLHSIQLYSQYYHWFNQSPIDGHLSCLNLLLFQRMP